MSEAFTNDLGMRFHRVPAGRFRMGGDGHPDERPRHEAVVSRSLHVAETPVTNAAYEAFDPEHRARRGARGLSTGDGEAAVRVSWHDARAFCSWLADREGRSYRLPTEAEWEYACRAGTTTPYHTGAAPPASARRAQSDAEHPDPASLAVGETPANDWGLRDVHGVVEEWCRDWYGPYGEGAVADPTGPETGDVRVTRGGSHNTAPDRLRSANRQGALPGTRNWHVGFRPVAAPEPAGETAPRPPPKRWARDVADGAATWDPPTPDGVPFFAGPERFVVASAAGEPDRDHHHQPSVAWCDNGDLLAAWYTCEAESSRDMTVLASRLRAGRDAWDPAAAFFEVPDRNLTGTSLFRGPGGTLYHVNGVSAAWHWSNLALAVRESDDDGATWSRPRFANDAFGYRNQAIHGATRTSDGALVQPCDAVSRGSGGTAVHVSRDGGDTWSDPGRGDPIPRFEAGETGGWIAGIHASVVELDDGRLLAHGRGDDVEGRLPRSVSDDGGETWTYAPSAFPPVGSGQRLQTLRLREGPLLFAGFTDHSDDRDDPEGTELRLPDGTTDRGYGLFAAVSFDEGETWPVRRLVSPGAPARTYDGGGWTGEFTADRTRAEPMGYLAATQTPDGVVHLLSSALHYRFDYDWLTAYA